MHDVYDDNVNISDNNLTDEKPEKCDLERFLESESVIISLIVKIVEKLIPHSYILKS